MYHQYLFIYLNKQKTRLSTLAYSKYEFSNVANNALYDQIYAAYVLYIYLYIFIIFLYSEISLRPCTVPVNKTWHTSIGTPATVWETMPYRSTWVLPLFVYNRRPQTFPKVEATPIFYSSKWCHEAGTINTRCQGDLVTGLVRSCTTVLFTTCFGLSFAVISGIINIKHEKSVMVLHL